MCLTICSLDLRPYLSLSDILSFTTVRLMQVKLIKEL